MKYSRILGMLFVGVFVTAAQAFAVPTLSLNVDGGAVEVNCSDGDGCDLNGANGAVTVSVAIGDFVVNVTTGITRPILPGSHMDLNSVDVQTTGGPHQLVIDFNETGYTSLLPFTASFGGTLSGAALNATALAYLDAGLICSIGPVVGPAFAGTCSGAGAGAPGYQLTQRIILNTGVGLGSFSGDFELREVPEPASMLLVGGGSLLLGLRRRRKSA